MNVHILPAHFSPEGRKEKLGKEHRFLNKMEIEKIVLSLLSCVILNKLLNISEPQFLTLGNGDDNNNKNPDI